jgi:hypothetical protein
MEQSLSLEINSHSASQEITHLLWNLKVHYRVHESSPTSPCSEPDAPSLHPPTLIPSYPF